MNKLRRIINWTITRKENGKVYIIGLLEDGTSVNEELERIDFIEHTASTETEIYGLAD